MKQAIMNNNNFNILNPYQNQDVSAYYVSIIAEGLEKCGYKIKWIIDANEINAGESVLIVSVYDYYRVKRKKPYQIFFQAIHVFWFARNRFDIYFMLVKNIILS